MYTFNPKIGLIDPKISQPFTYLSNSEILINHQVLYWSEICQVGIVQFDGESFAELQIGICWGWGNWNSDETCHAPGQTSKNQVS